MKQFNILNVKPEGKANNSWAITTKTGQLELEKQFEGLWLWAGIFDRGFIISTKEKCYKLERSICYKFSRYHQIFSRT